MHAPRDLREQMTQQTPVSPVFLSWLVATRDDRDLIVPRPTK
jgi:hypothetical protein